MLTVPAPHPELPDSPADRGHEAKRMYNIYYQYNFNHLK